MNKKSKALIIVSIGFFIVISLVFSFQLSDKEIKDLSSEKILDDPEFEVTRNYEKVVGDEAIVKFSHDSKEDQPISLIQYGNLDYELSKDYAKPGEEITLRIQDYNHEYFRIKVGSKSEIIAFGETIDFLNKDFGYSGIKIGEIIHNGVSIIPDEFIEKSKGVYEKQGIRLELRETKNQRYGTSGVTQELTFQEESDVEILTYANDNVVYYRGQEFTLNGKKQIIRPYLNDEGNLVAGTIFYDKKISDVQLNGNNISHYKTVSWDEEASKEGWVELYKRGDKNIIAIVVEDVKKLKNPVWTNGSGGFFGDASDGKFQSMAYDNTNGTGWNLNNEDEINQYNISGQSFIIQKSSSGARTMIGLAYDQLGDRFWGTDSVNNVMVEYDKAFAEQGTFSTTTHVGTESGACWSDDNTLWVTSQGNKTINNYNVAGVHQGSVNGAENIARLEGVACLDVISSLAILDNTNSLIQVISMVDGTDQDMNVTFASFGGTGGGNTVGIDDIEETGDLLVAVQNDNFLYYLDCVGADCVKNDPPSSSQTTITPDPAYSHTTIDGNTTVFDNETVTNLTHTYFVDDLPVWEINFTNLLNGTSKNSTLDHGNFTTGNNVTIQAKVFDGAYFGYNNNSIIISDNSPFAVLNDPPDNHYNSTNDMVFNCSATSIVGVVNQTRLWIDGNLNYTETDNSLFTTVTLPEGSYQWTCDAWSDIGSQGWNGTNRSLTIDNTPPGFIINSPIGNVTTLDTSIFRILNVSASDTNLQACAYNSTANSTMAYPTCNTTSRIEFFAEGWNQIDYTINDSSGNINTAKIEFYVYNITTTGNATDPISEAGSSYHYAVLNMTNITHYDVSAFLIWNNTNFGYGDLTNVSNDSINIGKTISVPSLNGTSSVLWRWNYTITDVTNISQNYNITGNQTYINLNISNCSATDVVVLNYTMYDETTRALFNTSLNNASIKVDLNLTSYLNTSLSFNFHGEIINSTEYLICLPNSLLNTSSYRLDSIAEYQFTDHVIENHYIVNFNLSNESIPKTLRLYDLDEDESTSFIVTYQDENYIFVQDAIVDVWRYFVGDGEYISVEHGQTDIVGQTSIHFITEDAIYRILVFLEGDLLFTSTDVKALCQETPCQINLREPESSNHNLSEYGDIYYNFESNVSARTVTLTFATLDGTNTEMNLTVTNSLNGTVVSEVVTSSGGEVTARIPIGF